MMKKNQLYKGFRVLDVVPVEDCNSTGIWLKHEASGMEVFHLVNSDDENLFAFSFRTPSKDSTGVAHVLEHSVLCGSRKYPLKDPFTTLLNQSVNTFLNAMTYPDHTVFPAATTVKADYFNLMSVYADAVFFPLLQEEVFMQEARRLEFDQKGKPVIQGVVFNECKGGESSFNSVAYEILKSTALKGTSYEHDSGGDSLEIPFLTHKMLKDFHAEHYTPANCLVFLYGNIPTEEQLDFISKNVLSQIDEPGKALEWEKFPEDRSVPSRVKAYGPAVEGEGKSLVNIVWNLNVDVKDRCRTIVELLFLSHILWGDDSAPVAKAVIQSGLGDDISPLSGPGIDMLFPIISCGIRGIDPKNSKKAEKLIFEALENVCRNGIAEDDLNRTCMAFDISNREVRRAGGPFSLVYMDRCLRGWQYGCKPWETLAFYSSFKELKEKLNLSRTYLSELINRYFLQNKNRVLVTVTPSSSWSKKRAAREKAIAKELLAQTTREKVLEELKRMHEFQKRPVSVEEQNLLPRIKVSDLSYNIEKIKTEVTECQEVPLFINRLPTNGITYFDLCFPVDVLPAKDYIWLSSLCSCITQVGWKGMPWDKANGLIQSKTGGIHVHVINGLMDCMEVTDERKRKYVGRTWLCFSFKALEDNVNEAFDLLSECISKVDFSDLKRISDLLTSYYSSFSSDVASSASFYASARSVCKVNRSLAITELLHGLTALFNLREISRMDKKKVASKFRNLFAKIKSAGAILHVTGTDRGVKIVKKQLPVLIDVLDLTDLSPAFESRDQDFFKLTELKGEKSKSKASISSPLYVDELIEIPGAVAVDSISFGCSVFGTKEAVAENVFCKSLSYNELWTSIRMEGGAYGAWLSCSSDNRVAHFTTVRDPKPLESIEAMNACLESAASKEYLQEEVDKSIIGCYSDEVTPMSPVGKGTTGFLWELNGLNNQIFSKRVKWLLKLKAKDVVAAAQRLNEEKKSHRTVMLCGKELLSDEIKENSGKIIRLPL